MVSLNIPASLDYDPIKPCAQLLRHDGRIAVGCIAFSDDDRIYAPPNVSLSSMFRQSGGRL